MPGAYRAGLSPTGPFASCIATTEFDGTCTNCVYTGGTADEFLKLEVLLYTIMNTASLLAPYLLCPSPGASFAVARSPE